MLLKFFKKDLKRLRFTFLVNVLKDVTNLVDAEVDDGSFLVKEARKITYEITENKNITKNTEKLKNIAISASDSISNIDFIEKIADALYQAMKHLLTNKKIREASQIAEASIDLSFQKNLTNFDKHSDKFLEFFKIPEAVTIGEDLINQIISNLDDQDNFQLAGNILTQTGFLLFELEKHEHAAAILGSSVYYQEMGAAGKKKIEELIVKMLDISRELALKNDESSQFYLNKANEISNATGIQVEGYGVQAAHSSYTEQLLSQSTATVRAKVKKFGRKHKKKRQFFGKKKN